MKSFYSFGVNIKIHSNINDPDTFYLTIRDLSIFAQPICSKKYTVNEVKQEVAAFLEEKQRVISELLKEVQ
jgi:hypothetical protein